MKVQFKSSFVKDLKRVRDNGLKQRVKETIERIEQVQTGAGTDFFGQW